jgi:hypothetical protein
MIRNFVAFIAVGGLKKMILQGESETIDDKNY